MRNFKLLISAIVVSAAVSSAVYVMADDAAATPPATPPSSVAATDIRNTICPVSGDKVGNSDEDEIYAGKVYHLCCPDCHKDFEKDPAKYAALVAANPAKYGIPK